MARLAILPDLQPGENLAGRNAAASWVHLLPRLPVGRAVVIGEPSHEAIATLERTAGEVVHLAGPKGRLAVADASVDAVAVLGGRAARRLAWDELLHDEVRRALVPGGRLYIQVAESPPPPGAVPPRWLPTWVEAHDLLALHTRSGELRVASSATDAPLVDALAAMAGVGPSRAGPVQRLYFRLQGRPRRRWRRETAVLHAPSAPGDARAIPKYVKDAAARAGVALDDYRWGLVDPGGYSSKKLLLYLFPPNAARPGYVVKMAREDRFSTRVENAWRSLTELKQRSLVPTGTVPEPVFAGENGGAAFMAETAAPGRSLRDLGMVDASSPGVRAGAAWLVDLGIRSSMGPTASGPQVAASLRAMLGRFVEVYQPGGALVAFLEAQIETVARHPGGVPLVLQHGDAGIWNVLYHEGHPTFLDWESAVTDGAPLWDLFHFLRSCAVARARGDGVTDPLRAFESTFLEGSPTTELLAESVTRFREATGLERALVEPLFHTCWMHRALKEASGLEPHRLRDGTYLALLRRCSGTRDAPGLAQFF